MVNTLDMLSWWTGGREESASSSSGTCHTLILEFKLCSDNGRWHISVIIMLFWKLRL